MVGNSRLLEDTVGSLRLCSEVDRMQGCVLRRFKTKINQEHTKVLTRLQQPNPTAVIGGGRKKIGQLAPAISFGKTTGIKKIFIVKPNVTTPF